MDLIKKIEIRHFRSIYSNSLLNIKSFNVFGGTNDSGKSNLLKALNLFFNSKTLFLEDFDFEKDYSKLALLRAREKKKGRQYISIKLYFNEDAIKGKNELKRLARENGGIWIERKWWRYNETSEYKQTLPVFLENASQGIKRSLSVFLDSIKFVYIPAFKNQEVFSYLLKLAGNTEGIFFDQEAKEKLNTTIAEATAQIANDFSAITTINTKISLPVVLESFWSSLQVSTEFGGFSRERITRGKPQDYSIDFATRGEGIKSIFAPVVLGWLANFSPDRYWIWAIDEPENSLESVKCVEIFKRFLNYSDLSQIFVSSHSPIFIFPQLEISKQEKVSIFIATQKEHGKTEFSLIDSGPNNILQTSQLREALGVDYVSFLEMQKNYSSKLQDKDRQLNDLKNTLNEIQKPILFVEDEYDQIYKIAWLKINNVDFTPSDYSQKFKENSFFEIIPKGGATNVAGLLNSQVIDEWKNRKIIGLFDFDDEGYKAFNQSLKDGSGWSRIEGEELGGLYRRRSDHVSFCALLLPVPNHRKEYASRNYKLNSLSIEFLFTDEALDKAGCYGGKENKGCGAVVTKIIGEKKAMWRKLLKLEKNDFESFQALFDRLKFLFDFNGESGAD